MREESHLDDMRAAIRGDFERLAQRRGEQDLMQEPPEQPEPTVEEQAEAPGHEDARSVESEAVAASPENVEEPPKRGFFARLLDL